jgi:PAS domain S-box-containing protein
MDITDRKETDELLHRITTEVSAATGEAFFKLLTQNLCMALKTDFACIGELLEDNDRVRTVSVYAVDKFWDEVEYPLAGTPCREALTSGRCTYGNNVRSAFPEDRLFVEEGIESYLGVALTDSTGRRLGVMSVMHRSPLKDVRMAETILNVFALRASGELERRRWERALRESETRNRAILSALPDLILVMDKQGRILDSHAKNPSELGLPTTAPGMKLDSVFTPEAAGVVLQSSGTVAPGDPAVVECTFPVSGQPRSFEFRTVGFGDDNLLTIVRSLTEKKRAEAELEHSRRFLARIAQTTPSVLFIYDLIERRNIYANQRSTDVIGYTPEEIEEMGGNFIPRLLHPDDVAMLSSLGEEYSRRKDGEVFEHHFRLKHKNGQWRWVQRSATIFNRTPDGRPRQILGAVTDITAFKQAESELRRLSARMMRAQDDERRRIARELHDVTGQNLAAISFKLAALEQFDALPPGLGSTLASCQALCRQSQEEIRTLSYVLFPPMLEFGLSRALSAYVDGFEKRTGIRTLLEASPEIGRFPAEMETDLFRVVQEGLANIMRHSGSESAAVRLQKQNGQLTLQIEDRGRGMLGGLDGLDKGYGVGLLGMRERLRQHGGSLAVRSSSQGTTLIAVLPCTSQIKVKKRSVKRAAKGTGKG